MNRTSGCWKADCEPVVKSVNASVLVDKRLPLQFRTRVKSLKGVVDVTLTESERDRTDDRFSAVYRQVHEMIRDEVAIALQRTK